MWLGGGAFQSLGAEQRKDDNELVSSQEEVEQKVPEENLVLDREPVKLDKNRVWSDDLVPVMIWVAEF